MAVLEQLRAATGPAEVRLTRTPLGGGGATVFTEEVADPDRRIRSCRVMMPQSVGDEQADVELADDALQASTWSTGDSIKIEGRGLGVAAWTTLADGFLGPSHTGPGKEGRRVTTLRILGWSAIADLISLEDDLTFPDQAWTTISAGIVDAVLGVGYARTITADAATPGGPVSFPAGMKLREALDLPRRALNAQGSDKWEHRFAMVAGTRTYLLYKRSAAILRTYGRRHLLPGSGVQRAGVDEVVNKAVVTGATVPSYEDDLLAATDAGNIRLSATTQRLAQPIDAPDTPIAAVTLTGNRSGAQDPPQLNLGWARNSQSLDLLGKGVGDNRIYAGAGSLFGVNRGGVVADSSWTTDTESVTVPATTKIVVARYDLGASPPTIKTAIVGGAIGSCRWILSYSDDDAAWTAAFTSATSPALPNVENLASPVAKRYWKLEVENTGGVGVANVRIQSWYLSPHKNEGADATNGKWIQSGQPDSAAATNATTSSTGAASKELVKIDMQYGGANPPIARIELRHSESTASVSLNLLVQVSSAAAPGAGDWLDIGNLPSTTSTVEDTIPVDRDAFRWLRVMVVDDRVGGSAAITTTCYAVRAYEHQFDRFRRPLTSDSMKGATASWDVSSLVRHPGTLEERTYPAPRTAVLVGGRYWMLLWLQAAATAYSWWDLDYSCSIDLTSLSTYCGFEEGSGTVCYDGSANAVNGTYTAFAGGSAERPAFVKGQVGLGCEFWQVGGTGNYVDFGFSALHNPTTALSFSMKVNLRAVGAKIALMGKGNGQVGVNAGSHSFFVDTDGKLLFAIWLTGGGVRKSAKSNTALVAGTDYTVGVKYDGANATFYLNGVQDGQVAMTGTIQAVTAGQTFAFGRAFDTGAVVSYGDGVYDEPYYFLRTLSDAEFLALHNMTTTKRLMQSPDSGVTWFSRPADMLLRTYVAFNEHQLVGTAEDAASQATYASLVPGGVLSGGLHDEALTTQAAVDAEAAALVNRRKTPPRRVSLVVPFDEGVTPGSRVRLEPEAAGLVGLGYAQTDVDVVQANHQGGNPAVSVLSCDEYPIDQGGAADATLAWATRRTI